ncbi:MAG TPA: uridine kinase [Armatimonadetes bacterium]|nr:uridine kinase [Armatimonadota bacterium]
MERTFLLGIAGGTGSGKTTVARQIAAGVGEKWVLLIEEDAYYRDLSHLPPEERAQVNFDHPQALDFDLLRRHLEQLRAGQAIERPVYDFATHTRRPETLRLEPRPLILVEGILVLAEPRIREVLDLKLFVDAPADLRFLRRLQRDLAERGRTVESVIAQYLATVRPMHEQFVEPSRQYADLVLPGDRPNAQALALVVAHLRTWLQGESASCPEMSA